MSSVIEKLQMSCIWLDTSFITRRNLAVSVTSSVLFFSGWWIIIAVSLYANEAPKFSYYLCGILSTLSFLMVNAISRDLMDRNAYDGGVCGGNGVTVWIVTGFLLGFLSIFASVAFFVAKYKADLIDQAVAVVLQNVLIVLASIIYRFGKQDMIEFSGF